MIESNVLKGSIAQLRDIVRGMPGDDEALHLLSMIEKTVSDIERKLTAL